MCWLFLFFFNLEYFFSFWKLNLLNFYCKKNALKSRFAKFLKTDHSENPLRMFFFKQSDFAVVLWKSSSITLSKRNHSLPLDVIRFNCLNWSRQNNFDTVHCSPGRSGKLFLGRIDRRREKIIKMQNTFHLDCTCSWLVFGRFFFGIDRLPSQKKEGEWRTIKCLST